ncbi:MAG: hypothetical protein WA840_10200 [Caulobacteraceae bacterium]
MALICLSALIRGRWPERITAIALAIAWVGSAAVEDRRGLHHPTTYHGFQPAIFAIDCLYGLFLGVLVAAVPRRWAILAAGCQLFLVGLHIVAATTHWVSQWDFFSAYYLLSWAGLASLAIGVAIEGRRPAPAPFPFKTAHALKY